MSTHNLLYEITHGEWLMDLRHLYLLRETLASGVSQRSQEREPITDPLVLDFYNADFKRISPRNVQEIPENSIVVINAVGMMTKYWNWYAQGSDELIWQLDFCNNLPNVAAIVLNVDGPGGAVSAIPPFMEFAQRKKKPIVALCDTALSLHYWMPLAIADHIMARNIISSRFGSVGVVSTWMDVSKYWEDMGVKEVEVYPEESKHKNEITRKIKENEKEGKQMLVDMHLRPLALKFREAVQEKLPNLKSNEEGVLTGRTFGAEKALELNMIHSIGTMADAMAKAQMLAEVSNY